MRARTRLWIAAAVGVLGLGGATLLWRRRLSAWIEPDTVCIVAPTFAYDPASGRPMSAPREVPAEARCPVCGMYPARQRRWAAQVIFRDGAVQYLDSPLSLFHYLQRVERYTPGRQAGDILAAYVTDQANGQWLPAEQAVYVYGSRLLGPMRAGNLPAFADRMQAQRFVARMGGEIRSAESLRRQLPLDLQQLSPHAHNDAGP